jgi:hypothetical protein
VTADTRVERWKGWAHWVSVFHSSSPTRSVTMRSKFYSKSSCCRSLQCRNHFIEDNNEEDCKFMTMLSPLLVSGIYGFHRKFVSVREWRRLAEQFNVVVSVARIVGAIYQCCPLCGIVTLQNVCLSSVTIPWRTPTSHLNNTLKHWTHPRCHPQTHSQIFRSLPLTPQPPSPTNKKLYSSHFTNMYRKYKH